MPDREELETRVNEGLDWEKQQDALIRKNLEMLRKAVGQVENVSGLRKGETGEQGY